MIPQVRAALRRFLEPLKPVKKAADAIGFSRAAPNDGGGYGAPGYEKQPEPAPVIEAAVEKPAQKTLLPPLEKPEEIETLSMHLIQEIKRGLTEVVVELHAKKIERTELVNPDVAADSYQTGALIRKGAVVDKKAS